MLDGISIDAAAIALLLAKLISSTALDTLLDREHLPQRECVQDEKSRKDPELHLADLHVRDFFVEAVSPT